MLQSQTDGHIVHLHSFVEVCIGCKLAAAAACRTAADAMSVSSRFRMINISLRPSGIEAYLDLEEIDTSGLSLDCTLMPECGHRYFRKISWSTKTYL